MINITNPDYEWLRKLLALAIEKQQEYPEIFSYNQEEIIVICEEILK